MNRRISLTLSFAVLSLMACCCGVLPRDVPKAVAEAPVEPVKAPVPVAEPAPGKSDLWKDLPRYDDIDARRTWKQHLGSPVVVEGTVLARSGKKIRIATFDDVITAVFLFDVPDVRIGQEIRIRGVIGNDPGTIDNARAD